MLQEELSHPEAPEKNSQETDAPAQAPPPLEPDKLDSLIETVSGPGSQMDTFESRVMDQMQTLSNTVHEQQNKSEAKFGAIDKQIAELRACLVDSTISPGAASSAPSAECLAKLKEDIMADLAKKHVSGGSDHCSSKKKRQSTFGPMSQDIVRERVVTVRGPMLQEKVLAEFVGTFMLVFTVGVAVASGAGPVPIGLMLAVQIYTFGPVSGAMFNPAVTLAVLLSRRGKVKLHEAGIFMAVQCFAGMIAGLAAFGVTQKSFCFDYRHLEDGNFGTSLMLEIIFTMALCNTVLVTGTSNDCPNQYFGFAIGMTVTGGALACGGFDQGSFNPAVTIGMNVGNSANGGEDTLNPSPEAWILFLFAPMFGACIAATIFYLTRGMEYDVHGALPNSE